MCRSITKHLHSTIGYVSPKAMLEGRRAQIHAEGDRKLEAVRQENARRQRAANALPTIQEPVVATDK